MSLSCVRISTQPIKGRPLIRFVRELLGHCAHLSASHTEDEVQLEDGEEGIAELIARRASDLPDAAARAWATALAPVLFDLSRQGWVLSYEKNHLWGVQPETAATRETMRSRFHIRRDQQLAKASVVKFLDKMEQWRVHKGQRRSILSLLRDGRDLLTALDNASPERPAIAPYMQFVTPEARCEHSGLRLQDIWRYFRHTWANPYESIPGRSLQILVRDGAAENHCVIGIAALSSAAVRLGPRDRFIGWDTDEVVSRLGKTPVEDVYVWARSVIDSAIQEVYSVDFVRDGLLPAIERSWSAGLIPILKSNARAARESHHRQMDSAAYKIKDPRLLSDEEWSKLAELPLFRAKRAEQLASLVELRAAVVPMDSGRSRANIRSSLLSRIVRIARSRTVGTEIADLTICGAVPPYSHLAAGKLVALLSVSPSAIGEYHRRYSTLPSTIASCTAGRSIKRAANLVYVGTTSLYGKRPNQYDRLSMPTSVVGGKDTDSIRYQHIRDVDARRTFGVGTFHFSSDTLKALEKFGSAMQGGWRVNNVFGEGTSPKLRGLRDGLSGLGLDADRLLVHGIEKCMYGVRLAANVDRYLLGMDETPTWIFDPQSAGTCVAAVSEWWTKRWARARFTRQAVIDAVRRETLVYPIRHGGRVPRRSASGRQNLLFES